MPVNFGSSSIKEIYFGSTSIGTVYFGNTLVWQKTAPPDGPTLTLDLDFKQAWGAAINDAVVIGPPALLTHTRASAATGFDESGVLQTAANDAPVFTHDPGQGDAAKGLLIESAGTNECLHSHEFDNAVWELVTGGTVTANTDNGPDGTLSADRLEDNNGVDYGTIRQSVVVTNNTDPWTWSIFVKKDADQTRFPEFQFRFGGQHNAQLNTETGEVGVRSGSFNELYTEDYGDFWRLVMVKNNAGVSSVDLYILPAVSSIWLGASSATTGSVICYGSQLEHGASPSSYIATTTAPATRAAGLCRGTDVSAVTALNSGTLYAEIYAPDYMTSIDFGAWKGVVAASNAGSSAYWEVAIDTTGAPRPRVTVAPVTGNSAALTGGAWGTSGPTKFAMRIAQDDTRTALDGVLAASDATHDLIDTPMDRLDIGQYKSGTAAGRLGMPVTAVQFYSTAFTDDELKTLTLPDPTLDLDFALNWGSLINDAVKTGPASFLTHTRASAASGFDESGVLQTAANDAPVFDHDPGNGNAAKGILIEEARTNEALNSEDMSLWTVVQSAIVTPNTDVAPDGTMTADTVEDANAGGSDRRQITIVVSPDTSSWCYSHYVKKTGPVPFWFSMELEMRNPNVITSGYIFLNTETGQLGTPGANVTASGVIDCGDWWRPWVTVTNNGNAQDARPIVYPAASTDGISYDNAATGSVVVWGAQVENAASPSSYIAATSAPASRSAVSCSGTDVSWYVDGGPGSFFVEATPGFATGNSDDKVFSLYDSGSANAEYVNITFNRINERIYSRGNSSGAMQWEIGNTAPDDGSITSGVPVKGAVGYSATDTAFYSDGVSRGTDASAQLPGGQNILFIGSWISSVTDNIDGHVAAIRYYPQRLADSVLQDITT